MAKKRGVKVAQTELVYDDNFNIVEKVKFVKLSEVLSGRREFAQAGTDWVIRKYEENGKINPRVVLKALAGIRALYAEDAAVIGRQIDVAIPFRLLDVIGSTLAGKDAWQREQTKAQRTAKRQKDLRWGRKAAEIRRRHPSRLSDSRVAELIRNDPAEWCSDEDGKVRKPGIRTITRAIRSPEK